MSFYTEILQKDPRFHSTDPCRDVGLLEPHFRATVAQLIADAAAEGTKLQVLETYRSQELQELYFRRGVTQLCTVGVHHYGLACDLGIVVDGRIDWDGDYSILGRLAAKHGLPADAWGGSWHSFKDYDHVQAVAVADQQRLFSGTWYPTFA